MRPGSCTEGSLGAEVSCCVLQVDDDVYLRLDRIQPAILQWRHLAAGEHSCNSAAWCAKRRLVV